MDEYNVLYCTLLHNDSTELSLNVLEDNVQRAALLLCSTPLGLSLILIQKLNTAKKFPAGLEPASFSKPWLTLPQLSYGSTFHLAGITKFSVFVIGYCIFFRRQRRLLQILIYTIDYFQEGRKWRFTVFAQIDNIYVCTYTGMYIEQNTLF